MRKSPVISSTAWRVQNGVNLLVQLAELVQVPVVDQSNRMNFPNTHHLNQREQAQALIRNADLIVGLEVSDFLEHGQSLHRQRLGQWIWARANRESSRAPSSSP